MSELTQVGFDYAALPVDLSVSLQLHADRYVAVRNRAAYEMGKEIYEAQQELASHDKTQGQFGAWVESLGITRQTGYDLITLYQGVGSDVVKLFDNKKLSQTVSVMLLRSPEAVIDKAVAKAESGEKVTVADVRDWKALEAELEIEKRRNREWMEQNKANRDKIRALELDLSAALDKPVPKPEIQVIEKIPADYETFKARAMELAQDLATLKKKQTDLVQQQVTAKLREREKEIADLDRQAKEAESLLDSLNKKISSYSSLERMTRLQRSLIEQTRSALVDLASHLEGLTPLENDPETDRLWDALADMLHNGALAIEQFLGRAKPALTVIRGSTA